MDLYKLKTEEIRGWDAARRKEAADDIRRELAKMKMDIYTAKNAQSGKIRGYKKSLARLLTVTSESIDKPARAAKVAAPKAAPAKKAAKAKAPKTEDKAKAATKAKGGKK